MSHLPGRTTQISQLLLVELVRLYSNLQARPETLLHFRRSALSHRRVCEETAPLVPQRVERRLGAEMIKGHVRVRGRNFDDEARESIRHRQGDAVTSFTRARCDDPASAPETGQEIRPVEKTFVRPQAGWVHRCEAP
jgi:hypothetical protein